METPYSTIEEVREAPSPKEANELLKRGFVLVKAVETRSVDEKGNQLSAIVYVLGRPRSDGGSQSRPVGGNSDSTEESQIFEKLPWKTFQSGDGEWTFLTRQDGTLVPELEPARELIGRMREGAEVVLGSYTYKVSGKFLKRLPA